MPDFCGDGGDFPGAGFCQLSGTLVMPDFRGDGTDSSGTAGTTVRAWQAGQGICRPAYCGSHSRRCPQWEQLNLSWLIRLSSLLGRIIGGNVEIVQLLLPWQSVSLQVFPVPAQTELLRGMGSWVLSLLFSGFRCFDLGKGGREPKVGEASLIESQQVAPIG